MASQSPPLQVTLLLSTMLLVVAFFADVLLAEDNPCKAAQKATNVDQEPIKCIGRLRKQIMIVTKNLSVLMIDDTDIDQNTSQSDINSIYFGDAKPKPLKEMYPDLVNSEIYKKFIGGGIPTCNPAVDQNG